ncbi:hypothetical protein E1286_44430 [Nonomuraea terrae]|uniref:Uncharacterized protein n=1 Tax=Nonomuraea terrae TaxID=2530383 RepID=A0A4R4XLB0_9ACTN|nr:hypothetical protein [Nonomuraea terrae]TDD31786.1 hypothetical protein E1286_44430 [Nonomuraea terrae]
MGNESVLCPVCQGVRPASGKESYTPLRGRLIVTNGYCAGGCAERRAEVVDQVADQVAGRPVDESQVRAQQVERPRPVVSQVRGPR